MQKSMRTKSRMNNQRNGMTKEPNATCMGCKEGYYVMKCFLKKRKYCSAKCSSIASEVIQDPLTETEKQFLNEWLTKYKEPVRLFTKYRSLYQVALMSFSREEINSICLMAAIKAVPRFDPSKSCFETYVLLYMRDAIQLELNRWNRLTKKGIVFVNQEAYKLDKLAFDDEDSKTFMFSVLNETERKVTVLWLEGLTLAQIGEKTNLTKYFTRLHLYSALQKIKAIL